MPDRYGDTDAPDRGWRQPWMSDEWVAWWTSLDHARCGPAYAHPDDDRPNYMKCRSMHCPDCGKETGSQGHRNCPERVKTR